MPQFNLPDIGIPKGALIIIAIIAVVYIIFKVFDISIKLFIKFLINALIGAALLFICNYVFTQLHLDNFTIPINWITAIVTGVLGVPGVLLILIYRLIVR
ncbi:MAG: pro-sigmaK processing inhibitor BofA family protein [Clostridia bacterium]|nr:pro-sigmaK processing inhibitor BofA family protein [Clostridia bacterium]